MDTLVSRQFYLQQPSQNSVWTPKQAVYLLIPVSGHSHKLPWGLFLEGPEMFSHPESCSKISILMITELFYSHINMDRGSLHTRGFGHTYLSVFGYRLIKTSFVGPKSFRGFQEMGPWTLREYDLVFSFILCLCQQTPKRNWAWLWKIIKHNFVNCVTAFCCSNVCCNYDLLLLNKYLLLMASSNTAVYSTVFSYGHNRSIAQRNRTKRLFNMVVFLVFTMFVVSWASLIHPSHP